MTSNNKLLIHWWISISFLYSIVSVAWKRATLGFKFQETPRCCLNIWITRWITSYVTWVFVKGEGGFDKKGFMAKGEGLLLFLLLLMWLLRFICCCFVSSHPRQKDMFFLFWSELLLYPFCAFPASVRVKAQWLDPMVYYWLVFLMGCFLLEISLHGWYRYDMLYVGYYRIKLDKTASMQLWVQDRSVERSSTDRIWPLWTKASWNLQVHVMKCLCSKREKQTSK